MRRDTNKNESVNSNDQQQQQRTNKNSESGNGNTVAHEISNDKHENSRSQGQRPPRRYQRNVSSGDSDKEKKIRNLCKKLSDITKLKSRQGKGEHLEANQLTKIAGETALAEELKMLKVSI